MKRRSVLYGWLPVAILVMVLGGLNLVGCEDGSRVAEPAGLAGGSTLVETHEPGSGASPETPLDRITHLPANPVPYDFFGSIHDFYVGIFEDLASGDPYRIDRGMNNLLGISEEVAIDILTVLAGGSSKMVLDAEDMNPILEREGFGFVLPAGLCFELWITANLTIKGGSSAHLETVIGPIDSHFNNDLPIPVGPSKLLGDCPEPPCVYVTSLITTLPPDDADIDWSGDVSEYTGGMVSNVSLDVSLSYSLTLETKIFTCVEQVPHKTGSWK